MSKHICRSPMKSSLLQILCCQVYISSIYLQLENVLIFMQAFSFILSLYFIEQIF